MGDFCSLGAHAYSRFDGTLMGNGQKGRGVARQSLSKPFDAAIALCVRNGHDKGLGAGSDDILRSHAYIGIALGWTTLITEVVWPTYQKYMRRLPKPDTLFVVERDGTGGEEVRFKGMLDGSEQKHHLFISYKWKTSFDKVLPLEPHGYFHSVPLTARCVPLGNNSGANALREAKKHWRQRPKDLA